MASKDSTFTENMKNERQTNNDSTARRLIRLYRANQCLWNRKSPGYHCTTLKQSAWNRITRILNNGLTPDQVKLQVLSLRTYYDMERQAIKRSQREGFHYVPCRSIFNDLQFLADQEPCEAEQSKSRPSVRDDQVQCIIDDVTEMMNKDCAECRHSLHVDFHIPIGERTSASSNMSFEDEELDNSSLYDSDLETLPTTLPRATSGADRYHHQQDEEESSDYSYHHQSRQQPLQGRGAREAASHRYSRPTENYNHSCHYGHRSQRTTYVSERGRAPGQQLQVQALRPRSGMEAGSNYDSQRSKNNEEACNVLLLKFNPRNAKNNKVICVNRPANYREPTTGNTSEQELQSAETPVYEDNEYRALPADEHAECRYNPDAQCTQNLPQNEQEECFYYPEGADPYEYLECYCPPHQYMAAANQLYLPEDDANDELPDRRRPQSQFYECGNTAPDAYRSRQCARPMEDFNPNRFERTPQTHPQYMPGCCSKDTTTMTVPNVESYDSRNSGPDSYMAQQCAAVAEQIMKDYHIRHFKCAHQKYPNDDRDYCDEPVARRPQRHYQTEDGEYVECPGRRRQQRRKEVEREASPARHRASTSSKVPKAREYKFPQQNFLASLKSDYSDQGERTPNQHSEKYRQDRYKYDDRECVKDCPRITGTKDCRGDKFPSTCLSALNDYNSEEDGQDKYYQKPSPASSPYEDYEADDEQSPTQFTQLRSSRREEPARSPPQIPRRHGPQPSHRYEECNDDRVVMQVEPRQAPRRTSDRGQYSEPLASPQQRRRSNEAKDLQTYPEERRPPSQRKQQQGPSNSDVEYIECPKRGLRPRSDNAEHEDPRNMEATDEPSMGNRSPPNSPSDSQLLSKQNSEQMYISQEELRDEDDDECRCEFEPAVPESTSPRRSMQNDRPDMQMGPDISQEENLISSRNEHVVAEIDATKTNSRDDSQTESTAPLIASSKKKRSHDFLGIPSSKRNSRNYQEKEPSPMQTPERGLHQQEDSVENPTHSQEFEELTSCNDETCPYANLNVPETISSMENYQSDSQLKPTPTSNQNYSCPENPMDILEIAECACEEEPTVAESTAAERSGQKDRQEEPTAPEIASSKRDSRQDEDSVPEIVSSKRNSRNDRREKPTAPSSKRASRNSRRNEPILDDADECRCEVELNVPGSTSPKRRRRNDRLDGRMVLENAPEKRISRQEGPRAPEISASPRSLTHSQEEPIAKNKKSKHTSKKVSRSHEKPIDPIEIDECPCDDERETPTRKRNSGAKKHANEQDSESEYEDAVNCELNPDECSKKANGGNSAMDTKSPKEASRTESEKREHSDLESGEKSPIGKNIQNEPGKSKSTEDIVEEKVKGRNKRKETQQTEEPTNETEPKNRKPATKDISMESSDETQPKTQRGRSNTAEGELSAQKKPRTQQNARALTLPAGGKSPRSHSAADRSGAVPKSRLRANSNPEEAAKKAIPARSSNSPCGRPNCPISGKRSMKHADSDGGHSRPFDLRLASYYICQLQDEDEANQYLIIVPEAKLRKISPHRDCPRQEPAKKKPCTPRQCSGFETLSWASSKPTPQSYPRNTEGVSALASYLVPPVATETTLSILKQHMPKSIGERKTPKELIQKSPKSNSSKKSEKPPPKILRKPKTKPMTSMATTQTLSHRPIHETNSILAENRTVLLTNNPDPKSNQEVIVLHPPVAGFAPSNSSLGLDDVQMRYVKVQHSQPHVS
ncbi:uncharacterized protein LOC117891260 [Drosophila subobscura]|uniref:uncharacterized protein LOC117891260 n=1 Tax=Drosophila subobscura TaxID=7241 RepID=UPI00155AE254|nr:uncharacterized protein LOC117891260 [Drosophila subobscura]